MADDPNLHNALAAIHSRLGTIEGRVTLIARAEREAILAALETLIRKKPLLGQIYLALNGSRNQTEVFEFLTDAGIQTSPMGVSRTLTDMHTEHGIVDLVSGGGSRVFRQGTDTEAVLNLSKKIREWLTDEGRIDPAPPPGRAKRRTSGRSDTD